MSQTPWKDLACATIQQASDALARPNDLTHAIARRAGFENSEHEALAFFASDAFDLMIDLIQSGNSTPHLRSPNEWAQDVADRAYGGTVTVVKCSAAEIPHRNGRRPKNARYSKVTRGLLLKEYSQIILAEQRRPRQLVLEFSGFSLEVANDICDP